MNQDEAGEGPRSSRSSKREAREPSFSGAERPIVQRVFKKLCNLSDTLVEIEGWIDSQEESETTHLVLPGSAKSHQLLITPENLDLFVAAERQAIVESREARGVETIWTA